MRFDTPLVEGRLLRRYMRFLADVELADGQVVRAHCPNPGSMMGLKEPGLRVWLEPNDDPRKKLDWGWRLAQMPGGAMVCVDTGLANRVVGAALRAGQVPGLGGAVRAEVPYGTGSRVDFLVDEQIYLEVKSVTLCRRPGLAEFPDSVTKRGAKHLEELAAVVRGGGQAMMLYLVQRSDCAQMGLAADLDPAYAAAFTRARDAGVGVLCYGAQITPSELRLGAALEFIAP